MSAGKDPEKQVTVPLLDLKAQHATIREEVREAVQSVFESQWFILGPTVAECEERIADYCNCPHAVGVSSAVNDCRTRIRTCHPARSA